MMSMPSTRFRVTFGGKSFPDYRPMSVVIPSQSEEVAREWATRQLEVWNLDPSGIKVEISMVKDNPPQEKVVESATSKPKARAKKKA